MEKDASGMTSNKQFKYFAFISYNSKDQKWGKRIQKKLEHYNMPSALCHERGWKKNPMRPIFFAPTDIQPGELAAEIKERLKASRHLIVVCSPNSARSEWVAREIRFFHELGRTKDIHFFIIDGIPHSKDPETECFNPVVDELGIPEILGVNIHEKVYPYPWLNRERAFVQLITKMLCVEFDSIWQRHKRLKTRQGILILFLVLAVIISLLSVWRMNVPVDVRMKIVESSVHNTDLPQIKDAVVTLRLDNEIKSDTLVSSSQEAVFSNIPRKFMDREVNVQVNCRDFIPLDTLLVLKENVELRLYRDPAVYGRISFRVWELDKGEALSGLVLRIADCEVISDSSGYVRLFVPLESQDISYEVSSDRHLVQRTIFMPCGEDDVLIVSGK